VEEKLLAVILSAARQMARQNNLPSQGLFDQVLSKDLQVDQLVNALRQLQRELLVRLCQEHLPEQVDAATLQQDFQPVMDLKNRLWSIITRKLYAPEPADLTHALTQVATLEKQPSQAEVFSLEEQWIGLAYPDDVIEKRLSRLKQHLSQQQPYSQLWAQQNAETIERWKQQQIDTRGVKMLWLMAEDIEQSEFSKTWEAADELLTKIEIGFFSLFRYRKNRQLVADVLDSIDVKAFCEARPELAKKKQQLVALSDAVETQMAERLASFRNLTIPLI
jgi:hypothetical protein